MSDSQAFLDRVDQTLQDLEIFVDDTMFDAPQAHSDGAVGAATDSDHAMHDLDGTQHPSVQPLEGLPDDVVSDTRAPGSGVAGTLGLSHEQGSVNTAPSKPSRKPTAIKYKSNFKADLGNASRKDHEDGPPSPEPQDSHVDHDMDGRPKTSYAEMIRFMHRLDINPDDESRGLVRQQTEITGLNTILGIDEIDRKRPSWLFAPETKSMNCLMSSFEDFSGYVGPSTEKFNFRLTLDSGHRLCEPSVIFEVYDMSKIADANDGGLRFKAQWEPGVQSLTKGSLINDDDHPMEGSAHATDGDNDLWEVDAFRIEVLGDLLTTDPETFGNIVSQFPPIDMQAFGRWAYIKMAVNGGRLYKQFPQLAEYKDCAEVTNDLVSHLNSLKSVPRLPDLQFLVEIGDNANDWVKEVQQWWKEFMEKHYPPMEPYYNADYTEVDVRFGMQSVQEIGNHAHCMYPKETERRLKADFTAKRPVRFPLEDFRIAQYPKRDFWSSGAQFEAMFAAGIAQEADYVSFEAARLIEVPHKIMVTKTLDSWEADEKPSSEVQKTVRQHYWMHVWLGVDRATGRKFLVPPKGTWMHVDPLVAGAKTHIWSKKRHQWFGYVTDSIDSAVRALAPDFSIFVRRPWQGRPVKIYHSLRPGQKLVNKAMLDPFFDRKTEERQLAALKNVCNVRNTHLQHIAFPLFFQPERWGAEGRDWRAGPDLTNDQTAQWESLLDLMVQYRNMDKNEFHKGILKWFERVEGAWSIIRGSAGSAKTTLVCDCAILLNLVGHTVWVAGEQQIAVDNIANAYWDCYNLALKESKDKLPTVYAQLLTHKALRYESSALPDLEKVECMVRKTDQEYYQTQGPDTDSFLDDPLTKSILSLFAANNLADEASMDEVDAEERRVQAETVEIIKDTYQKVMKAHAGKVLRFPRVMTMSDRLVCLREEDVRQGNAPASDKFAELQERLRRGRLGQGNDEDLLNMWRSKMILRVIRESDIIFGTLAAFGDDPIKESGTRPDWMFMEEGSQITIPAAMVGVQHAPKHCCVVGDLRQIEPHKASAPANAAYFSISRSFIEYLFQKGIKDHECRIQFRTPSECFQWPNAYFYGGRTHNGPDVDADHPSKDSVRSVALQYGIKGKEGKGALFFVVNVPGGVGMKEENGNSLENYGEAEAVLRLIEKLVKAGMAPEDISVIAWYRGQLNVVNVLSKNRRDYLTKGLDQLTVDQSQGETKGVVILTVGASALNDINKMFGSILSETSWKISSHVRLASRLCVALTRSKHGTILVCNARSLVGLKTREDSDPMLDGSAWEDLFVYAEDKSLIATTNLIDTNPRLGKAWDLDFQAKMEEKMKRAATLGWLSQGKSKVASKRDRMQQQVLRQKGVSAPQVMGRKGKGSGIVSAFPGDWAKAAYQRQTAAGVVEHGKADGKGKAKKKRAGRGPVNTPAAASSSGTQPTKRKADDDDLKSKKKR